MKNYLFATVLRKGTKISFLIYTFYFLFLIKVKRIIVNKYRSWLGYVTPYAATLLRCSDFIRIREIVRNNFNLLNITRTLSLSLDLAYVIMIYRSSLVVEYKCFIPSESRSINSYATHLARFLIHHWSTNISKLSENARTLRLFAMICCFLQRYL